MKHALNFSTIGPTHHLLPQKWAILSFFFNIIVSSLTTLSITVKYCSNIIRLRLDLNCKPLVWEATILTN